MRALRQPVTGESRAPSAAALAGGVGQRDGVIGDVAIQIERLRVGHGRKKKVPDTIPPPFPNTIPPRKENGSPFPLADYLDRRLLAIFKAVS